jgi:hypothetical protein
MIDKTENKVDPAKKRTLFNWMMDVNHPEITPEVAKKILDSGKIEKDKAKLTLISYGQLKTWGVI